MASTSEPEAVKGSPAMGPPLPQTYWESYETVVDSLQTYLDAVLTIASYETGAKARFAWRGAADANWALYSSLVRAYVERFAGFPTEPDLRRFEGRLLAEARAWKLDWHPAGGRLSALELIAAMQHYWVPSRLIDFTFNPVIALWFAVEKLDDRPGRVFAVNVAGRELSAAMVARVSPWWWTAPATSSGWASRPFVWSPPPMEPRIARQEACLLMGGIPSTFPARNYRHAGGWHPMSAVEVRMCMSLPFQLIGYKRAEAYRLGVPTRGRPPKTSAFTIRIENKKRVRHDLEQVFGYAHRSLFPDMPGFREYGRTWKPSD